MTAPLGPWREHLRLAELSYTSGHLMTREKPRSCPLPAEAIGVPRSTQFPQVPAHCTLQPQWPGPASLPSVPDTTSLHPRCGCLPQQGSQQEGPDPGLALQVRRPVQLLPSSVPREMDGQSQVAPSRGQGTKPAAGAPSLSAGSRGSPFVSPFPASEEGRISRPTAMSPLGSACKDWTPFLGEQRDKTYGLRTVPVGSP